MTLPLIAVTGASGQLGRTLSQLWNDSPHPQYRYKALDRAALDLAQADTIDTVLSELEPSIIINAAAYTQVDKAESDRDAAFSVNAEGVRSIAAWTAAKQAKLIHVSTDFVFDGAGKKPYEPDDQTSPLGAYGTSKLAGEKEIQAITELRSAIVRTSWLYSEYGNNFVKTMLRLMGEKEQLSVVDDQLGSPTSTHGLAALIFAMIRQDNFSGIYHWSDGASISWYEFAVEIQQQALAEGLLSKAIPISPISSSEYPAPARRPAYSVLDRSRAQAEFECPAASWKAQLNVVLKDLAKKLELERVRDK
jgi:dTDP-4-dehydrorhamnose reductase